jgi:hypothetical protein
MAEAIVVWVEVKDRYAGLGHAGFRQAGNRIEGFLERFALGHPFENSLLPLE